MWWISFRIHLLSFPFLGCCCSKVKSIRSRGEPLKPSLSSRRSRTYYHRSRVSFSRDSLISSAKLSSSSSSPYRVFER